MRSTVKAKDFAGTVKRLLDFTKPYWIKMIIVILMAISATALSIMIPKFMGAITSKIVEGIVMIFEKVPNAAIDMLYVRNMLLLMAFLYTASAVLGYLQAFVMIKITQRVNYELRVLITQKINTLPLKYFDTEPFGDVLSRITNDIDTIGQSLQQSITQVITAITTVIGILIMMLSINLQMTLISLISLPVSLYLITNIVKIGQKYFRRRASTLGALNGHIEETFGAHPIIKVFNAESEQIEKFSALSQKLYKDNWMAEFIGGLMMPIISFIGNLSYVAVSVLGAYLVIEGKIKVGDIQAFIQYTRNFSQPINQVANIGTLLQSTVAAAEHIFFIRPPQVSVALSNHDPITQALGQTRMRLPGSHQPARDDLLRG